MSVGLRTLIACLAALSFADRANAQIFQWQVTDGVWSVPGNWDAGTPPSDPTTQLVFGGGVGYTSTNDLGAFTLNRMTFSNAGNVLINGAGTLTFAGTTPTIEVQNGSAEIASVIGGSTLITKAGGGALTLSGANTFTGGLTLSQGTLLIGVDTVSSTNTAGFPTGAITSSAIGTGTLTLSGGTLGVIGGNRALRNVITVTGTNSVIDIGAGLELTTTNTLNGADPTVLTKTGAGLWRIADAGAQTNFVGTLIINGGTVLLTDPTNAGGANPIGGDLGAKSIVVNNTGRFIFGSNPAFASENPDFPATTYITANAGGVVEWNIGEDFGGVILNGGAVEQRGNMNFTGTAASEIRSGTITSLAGSLLFGGSGGAAINKTTAGTVTVVNANLGGTGAAATVNIQNGVISTNAGFNGTAAVTFGSTDGATAGTLQYTGASGAITRPVTVNAGGGIVQITNSGTTVTATGALTLNGLLQKTGPGTLQIAGTSSGAGGVSVSSGVLHFLSPMQFTGGTDVNGGILRVDPNATPSTSPITVVGGAVFEINSQTGGTSFTAPSVLLADGSFLRFLLNTNTTPTAPLLVVSNSDGLSIPGVTHTLQIVNPQTFVGTFTAIDYSGTGITSGFTLLMPGRTAGSLIYDTVNTRIDVNITGADSIKWGGQINGEWNVGTEANVGGTNNWRLVSNNNDTNFIQTDVVTFDDTASGNFTISIAETVLPTSMLVDTANTYTFTGAGAIGGSTALTKQGTGTLILGTNNTYTGLTTVSDGVLQIGNGGAVGNLASAVSLAGGTTLALNRSDAFTLNAGAITASGNATIAQNGAALGTVGSALNLGGTTFTVSGAGDSRFTGIVTGAGSIIKDGAGTATFTADNSTFTGTITINGGTFAVADLGAGGDIDATSIVVNNTGTFHFVGPDGNADLPDATFFTVNAGGTARFSEGEQFGGLHLFGGALDLVAASTTFVGPTASQFNAGLVTGTAGTQINGAGAITKDTAGVVTITGVNLNNLGGVSINDGVLAIDANFVATGTLSLGAADSSTAGTLRLTNTDTGAVTTINKPILINDGSGTISVSTAGKVYNLSGVINGLDGSLTKSGAGTLVLSGTNIYQGQTFVNEGVLLVNGALNGGGAVTVAANARLGGSGTIAGHVTINGGTLAPGASPGNLTLPGGLTMNSGDYLWELGALTETGAGANFDIISVTGGTATLGGTSAVDLAFVGTATDPNGGDTFWNADRQWVILDATGATLNGIFGSIVNPGWATGNFTLSSGGSQVFLNWTFAPVPEPGVIALVGLAGASGLVLRWRRRGTATQARI